MGEIGGTVERIDDPAMLALMRVGAALLGQNRMSGKSPLQDLDDGGFGLMVGLGDQVNRITLAGNAGAAEPFEMGSRGGAGGAKRHFVDFNAVGHGSKLCDCQRSFQHEADRIYTDVALSCLTALQKLSN